MRSYEFTLLVEGADLQTSEAQDALFEAGCDDSTIGVSSGVQHLHFDREADSLAEWFTGRLGISMPGAPDPALSAVNGLLEARAALAQLDSDDRDAVLALQPAVRAQLLTTARPLSSLRGG